MENSQKLLTTTMNDYSTPEYKDLYEEILKDYHYRWGKFSPIPYPFINKLQDHEQQRNSKIAKPSN